MEKVFVVQRVANKLFSTEDAVDGALSEATELMAEMIKARKDLKASLIVNDKATTKLVEAIAALGEARAAMVAMHNELSEVKLRLGVRTKMDGWDTNKFLAREEQAPVTLREVG